MTTARIELPEKLIPVFDGPADVRGAKGGRGSAKTRSFAKMLATRGMMFGMAGVTGQLLCGRQFMNTLDDSSLEECKRAIEEEDFLSAYYDVGDKYIKSRDGRIWFSFVGLDRNIESVKSKGRILICWVDEARPVTEAAWKVLLPTLREEGEDWNAELWVTWNPMFDTDPVEVRFSNSDDPLIKVVDLNYTDNNKFPAKLERQRLRDKEKMSKAEYDNVWEGKFLPAVVGAIYFNEIERATEEGRITRVSPDKLLKVHAIFDLGWNDCMTIVMVQRSASELRVVDYIEDSHKKLSDYSDMLKSKPYTWGKVWLPHDGFAKDYKTGKSADEMLRALGWTVARVPNMDIEGGIKAAREVFERVWFDKDKAARLVECLKRYRRNIGQKTGEGGTPLHDEFSHGADSFRYMALVADQLTNTERKRPSLSSDGPTDWMGA